ncbi:gph: sugar (Glycoside-Pentoside-Hexuronide) transporter [Tepidimonas alkaliphilus]|uniref:Gph: sugar (Glycoside-Pentoside-Hexuronide) transporter n=1 Tax=Tepidimonas alkaliphilus TaxID=2588942 RepID=A0A554W466_9BURK|nr:MFS transporter [Tepidimonas alkaliphilus]TSE18369.1 gph: sugar (Glycoside-Pentoside-Hexuronide) transporter [Tepidimonas alkaliphilus]
MNGAALPPADGLRYGLLGLPLAFAALPLYVHVPHVYAQLGVPLAWLGAVLLAARAFDAVTDPWLGRAWDRAFARGGSAAVLRRVAGLAALLALAMAALLRPPALELPVLAAWALAGLLITTLAYSALAIVHQSWAARLGGDTARQARLAGWREGLALAGVVLASLLPGLIGWSATLALLAALLALGTAALARAPRPPATSVPESTTAPQAGWDHPWRQPAFRRLAAVFVVSGLASAIPATLALFFIADRLQATAWQGPLLALYFLAAAAGLPLWLRLVRRLGAVRAWGLAMLLAVASFAWTATLGAGDVAAFAVICALSGLALGADLALPPALLAGVVAAAGERGRHDGAYFGWWSLLAKANLALAAGLALPLLQRLGYQPGGADPVGLQALTLAYAVLPCALKLLAAALLATLLRREALAPAAGTAAATPACGVHPS